MDPIIYMRTCRKKPPTLKRTDKGFWVGRLYWLLITHGITKPGMLLPDVFDYRTEDAVKRYQLTRSIKADGVVGPETWSHLAIREPLDPGQRTIQIALREFYAGAQEIGGNNRGYWVKKYTAGHEGDAWAWCVAFATWCYQKAALATKHGILLHERFSTSALKREAEKRGRLVKTPTPGDFVMIPRKHTALFLIAYNDWIYVIEGNVTLNRWPWTWASALPKSVGGVRIGRYRLGNLEFARG